MKEIKIFGKTCSVELLIIGMVIAFIAGGYLLCGSMTYSREGFDLEYNNLHTKSNDVNSLNEKPGSIDFYAKNKISPYCKSNASSYGGQVCLTEEQINTIKYRGMQ